MKTHLVFASLTILLLFLVITNDRKEGFSYSLVQEEAQEVFHTPWVKPVANVPKFLLDLNYDQYRDIRWRDDKTLWRDRGYPFQLRFFHPGHIFNRYIQISEAGPSGITPVRFSPDFFHYGKNNITQTIPETLGYAGFRIHYPLNRENVLDELAVFQGASYFRCLSKGTLYGLSARGLAINTVLPKVTEEFPVFTKFWLVPPGQNAREMRFYALLESESVCGAYEFTLEPGEITRMRVKATLTLRKLVERFGIAPLTSMFWFGENTSNTFGDFRPEVHDSDGLLMHTGANEWIWRPLAWSRQIQYNGFTDNNPRGFGLLQRDRDFNHYQDLEASYNKRPSVWIEPVGNWGEGKVELIQLPTSNEFMDNVNAFWVPAKLPAIGEPITVEYVLHWYQENAQWPPLARCLGTRVDSQDSPSIRNIILEFSGDQLNPLTPENPPEARVDALTNGVVSNVVVMRNDYNNAWRVSFQVDRQNPKKPVEMTCNLHLGAEPLSEKWTYTWTP